MTEAVDRFFDSGGMTIRYRTQGSGVPLVLIHGFSRSIEAPWVNYGILDLPWAGYQLIALDCRGHGQSSKSHDAALYGRHMVDDIVRLLDHLHLQRAHLLGHSMGAEIALRTAVDYPERVSSAILAGSGWSDDSVYALFAPLGESLEQGRGFAPLLEWITPAGQPGPSAEEIDQLNAILLPGNDVLALAAICRNYTEQGDLRVTEAELRATRVPMLGVAGEHDGERPMLERMQGVVPDFTLRVLPGLGHGGPDFFNTLAHEAVVYLDAMR